MAKNSARTKTTKKKQTVRMSAKKTPAKKPYFGWLARNRNIIVVVLVVMLAVGTVVYRKYERYQEKQRFEQARQSIEKLYTAIEAEAPKPDEVERKNYCSYSSEKFGKGQRSCAVAITLVYRNAPDNKANETMNRIDRVVKQNTSIFKPKNSNLALTGFGNLPFGQNNGTPPYTEPPPSKDNSLSYTDSKTGLGCSISYSRDEPYDSKYRFEDEDTSLYVRLVCSDYSKVDYYPGAN